MAKPTPEELAVLKVIATSLVHIVGIDNLLFVSPYLVEYQHRSPFKLWMPNPDWPFTHFWGDVGTNSYKHNKKLWEKYHFEGREKADCTIWKFLDELNVTADATYKKEFTVNVKPENVFLTKKNEEFILGEAETSVWAIVGTIYQSCGTLIAVISLGTKNVDNVKNVVEQVRGYLTHLTESRYLDISHELLTPRIDCCTWRQFRTEREIHHYADNENFFRGFVHAEFPYLRELKVDFGSSYKRAIQLDENTGRPSLKDVLSRDSEEGRIGKVVENRIKARLGSAAIVAGVVSVLPEEDYLWFNALAVADAIAAASVSYANIKKSSDIDRCYVKKDAQSHGGGDVSYELNQTKINNRIKLDIKITEPDLHGVVLTLRGGESLESIYDPASIAGAHEVIITTRNGIARVERRGHNKDLHIDWTKNNDVKNNFTGVQFTIEGEFRESRVVVTCGDGND